LRKSGAALAPRGTTLQFRLTGGIYWCQTLFFVYFRKLLFRKKLGGKKMLEFVRIERKPHRNPHRSISPFDKVLCDIRVLRGKILTAKNTQTMAGKRLRKMMTDSSPPR
jgi:hypothetical protein